MTLFLIARACSFSKTCVQGNKQLSATECYNVLGQLHAAKTLMRRDFSNLGLLTAAIFAGVAVAAGAAPQTGKSSASIARSKHWAYQPPVCPPVPKVGQVGRVRNPIDAFLLTELERKGLTFSPDAPK